MRKILTALCAGALSLTMVGTTLMPSQAAPVFVPKAPETTSSDVIQVQDYRWRNRGGDGRYGGRNFEAPNRGWDRGGWGDGRRNWNRDGRRGYYRDHYRGDRYRGNNLGGAVIGGLITGAIVGGVLNNSRPVYREQRVYRGGNAHVQWCYDRYQTYRASDNTYVPRVGVRAYCNSPYN